MPVSKGVNLALLLAKSGVIESAVHDVMVKPQVLMATKAEPSVKTALKKHVMKWRGQMLTKTIKGEVVTLYQDEIDLYQQVCQWQQPYFITHITDVVNNLENTSDFYFQAKQLISTEQKHDNPMFQRIFCEHWYQYLVKTLTQTHQEDIDHQKQKLFKELYQRIDTMKKMVAITTAGDEHKVGRLWDMAQAKLTTTDVETIKTIVLFLKNNQALQQIADKLGRMASENKDENQQQCQTNVKLVEEVCDNVTDDIVGINEGDDLNKLLPNEVMFLADPELDMIFYQHFADKRLLNYHTQGIQRKLRKVKACQSQPQQLEQDKGPFIVCIDASGSMSGTPENCAKALAYSLMEIALTEDRDCYVIMFSTQQITYELTQQDGITEMVNFLSYSFHGGTDLSPVLDQSIELMSQGKYKNADLVVLSDFIAPSQPKAMQARVNKLKHHKNRFHAVSLSKYGNPELLQLFDHCWSYHPSILSQFGQFLKIK